MPPPKPSAPLAEDGLATIIFDCDGVLIDSEAIACRADALLLAELGYPLHITQIMAEFPGHGERSLAAHLLHITGQEVPKAFWQLRTERIKAALDASSMALIAPAQLAALRGGWRLAIASNSRNAYLEQHLGRHQLLDPFAGRIYSAASLARPKPAPDLYHYTLACLGISARHAWVVEDSVVGTTAAHAAGLAVIGFLGGGHNTAQSAANLQAAGARLCVHTHDALVEFLADNPLPLM
jgi:beta-phosphoglucomutase-like phosphatase (HAD superfamily)